MSTSVSLQLFIELLSVVSLTAISYVSTNFDNLVILSAYGARPGYRPFYVKLTFVLVCLTVLLLSLVLANAADALPAGKLRYLGLIPITLGGYYLFKLIFDRSGGQEPKRDERANAKNQSLYLGFALVLLANSGDTISLLTPIFADLKTEFLFACFAAVVAMAVLMSSIANILSSHPVSRSHLEKLAARLLPFLLIGIGLLILTDKPSDIFVVGE